MGLLKLIILVSSLISTAFACGGYEVRDFNTSVCNNKTELIRFKNFSVYLTDDCRLMTSGSIIIKKDVAQGRGSITVRSLPQPGKMTMPMNYTENVQLCSMLQRSKHISEATMLLKMMNVQQKCPLIKGELMEGLSVSVEKYKDKIKFVEGKYVALIKGRSNVGDLCVEGSMTIAKKGV